MYGNKFTINAQLFRYLTEGAILKNVRNVFYVVYLVCYVQLDKPEMYWKMITAYTSSDKSQKHR